LDTILASALFSTWRAQAKNTSGPSPTNPRPDRLAGRLQVSAQLWWVCSWETCTYIDRIGDPYTLCAVGRCDTSERWEIGSASAVALG
jgi:hypothetical protein